MRISKTLQNLVGLSLMVQIGGLLTNPSPSSGQDRLQNAAPPSADARFTPYSSNLQHPWNRVHEALFVRHDNEGLHVHSTDPLLYRGGTFLLQVEPYRRAVTLLDQFWPNQKIK